jgi:quinoprotein glucose dehydrogenase/quinate dehydrogenase (quinone)
VVGALIFLAAGLPLVWGGALLIRAGGSTYYLIAGLLLAIVGVLLWRGHRAALWLYALVLAGTILWALAEAGLDFWALLPRIFGPVVLGLWFAIPAVRRRLTAGPRLPGEGWANPALFVLAIALLLGGMAQARFHPVAGSRSLTAAAGDPAAWDHYGGDQGGSRFTPAALITPANAAGLEKVWTYRTGELPPANVKAHINFQAVPLKIGDGLYFCTPGNNVVALDADTGKQIWRAAPHINTQGIAIRLCRGLSYYAGTGEGLCAKRLLMGTVDDQLLAFDLKTGVPCPDFGNHGSVDLKVGLGKSPPGFHFVSSPPAIVRGVAVVGSFVYDNQTTDAPPGVIRAYDVITGQLKWAWDGLRPTAYPPLKPGENYPRSGPNSWTLSSADEALGLVYVPTGNPSPDFWGGNRTREMERYGSSIIALDAATGNVRWSFQTTHHDIWDYDIGSQPVLTDLRMPGGAVVPALLAPTKRGEIFVLDRRTGKPLVKTVERPAPQGPALGDRLSPTQPYSVGFPSFTPKDLTEASMWGVTPIDQLWCRIAFHRYRYDGQFTPGTTRGAIHYAGSYGVIDWGSLAVDKARRIAIVNTSGFPFIDTLIPRKVADAAGMVPYGSPPVKAKGPPVPTVSKFSFAFPQTGAPFAVDTSPFVSILNFPCHTPPWGGLVAIDLDTRKILWRQRFGTTRGSAPLGLDLPIGTFNLGGAVTTGGGVTFIAATIDGYIRAFDTVTGRELWRAALPAGGQSNPISYVSQRTGRQYVVMVAGGHSSLGTPRGDYVVAYALPTRR